MTIGHTLLEANNISSSAIIEVLYLIFIVACPLLLPTAAHGIPLVHPLVITVATDKNQSQGITLGDVGLKKNSFVMITIGTICIL